jgi:hypothetical protein
VKASWTNNTRQDRHLHSRTRSMERIVLPVLRTCSPPSHVYKDSPNLLSPCLRNLRRRPNCYSGVHQPVGSSALTLDFEFFDKYCNAYEDGEVTEDGSEVVTEYGGCYNCHLHASLSPSSTVITRAIFACAAASSNGQDILQRYLLA